VRHFVRAISLYQQALDKLGSLSEFDNILAIRLHRKIVEVATTAKWSVDAETYHKVHEISQESQSSLEESLTKMEGEPPHPEVVHLLVSLSLDAWRNQDPADWEAAQRYAEAAVKMAQELDDPVLTSQALGVLANVLDGQSLLRQHLKIAQQRFDICQAPDFENKREKIDALRGLGLALMYVGEHNQAIPHLDLAETMAVEIQAPDQIANALGIKAQCFFRMDQWDSVLEMEEKWRDLDLRYTRERVGET